MVTKIIIIAVIAVVIIAAGILANKIDNNSEE